jgi:hypothetical protein
MIVIQSSGSDEGEAKLNERLYKCHSIVSLEDGRLGPGVGLRDVARVETWYRYLRYIGLHLSSLCESWLWPLWVWGGLERSEYNTNRTYGVGDMTVM